MAKTAKLQNVAIEKLVPYERNAKMHDQFQVDKLKESIKRFGFVSPILIDEQNNVLAGHGRILAARELGMDKIPAVYVEGLSEAERRAYILADNKLSELGEWSMDLVEEELKWLDDQDFEIDVTGFDLVDSDLDVSDDDFIKDTEITKSKEKTVVCPHCGQSFTV